MCFLYVFAAFLLLLLLLLLYSFCVQMCCGGNVRFVCEWCVFVCLSKLKTALKNHRMHVFSPEFLLAAFVIIITSRSEEEE